MPATTEKRHGTDEMLYAPHAVNRHTVAAHSVVGSQTGWSSPNERNPTPTVQLASTRTRSEDVGAGNGSQRHSSFRQLPTAAHPTSVSRGDETLYCGNLTSFVYSLECPL